MPPIRCRHFDRGPGGHGHGRYGGGAALSRRRCLAAVVGLSGVLALGPGAALAAIAGRRPRVLHVMSYHATLGWSRDQDAAFRAQLEDLDPDYRVFEMDCLRNPAPEWKQEMGAKARALIADWRPDLVYASDDIAQTFVVGPYDGPPVPFVFSGVNADPAVYGYQNRRDVTGTRELVHFGQTIRLLQEMVPEVRRIGVLLENFETSQSVAAALREPDALPDGIELEVTGPLETFAAYQRTVMDFQERADALVLAGVFALRDESGVAVRFQEVTAWTAEHSRLPDLTFWQAIVSSGGLCAVVASGPAQGESAGGQAREILVDGRTPDEVRIRSIARGQPMVNLARARQLGISVPSTTLLNSKVFKELQRSET